MRRRATRGRRRDGFAFDAQFVADQRGLVAGVHQPAASRAVSAGVWNFAGTSGAAHDERRLYHRRQVLLAGLITLRPDPTRPTQATARGPRPDRNTPPHHRPQWLAEPSP